LFTERDVSVVDRRWPGRWNNLGSWWALPSSCSSWPAVAQARWSWRGRPAAAGCREPT